MKKLFFTASCLAMMQATFAQVDTTNLDLGTTKLNKALTQTITIKGRDLRQFPFANLSEAINVWFNGALNNRTGTMYIVDGSLLADANVLSIYDIEEITLVQNAVSVYNTAGVKQLILIKTKRTAGEAGSWQAAAQGYVVSSRSYDAMTGKTTASENEVYHQYYLGYRKKVDKLNFGLSANYLHDVTPRPENFQYVKSKPFQLNRFRFNGYADQQLGASTMLSLSLNYAPQKMVSELELGAGAAGTPGNYEFLLRQKNNVFNGSLGMRSDFGKGWFNHFTAAYSSYHVNTNNNTFSMFSNELFGDERDSAFKAKSWWIRNQAGYTAKTGNWQFEPSINVVYRRIDDRLHAAAIRTINNGVTERAEYNASQKGHLLYAVPSFGIQYRSLLALQTGVLQSLKKQPDNFKKFTPYVTASANIVGLIKPAANWSLHTFASYAVANDFGETYYAPNDLLSYNVYKDVGPRTVSGNFDGIKQLQLGATAALFHDRLQFSYNRYQSEFQQLLYVALPGGNPSNFIVVPAEARTVLDRAGISVQVQNTDFKWTTGINASNRRLTLESSQALPGNKKPKEWTGGWVNRIQYGSFNFQLDLAYWTNRQWFNPFVTPQRVEKINSFSLQYIQLGYRFKQLEVYAGARNLFENKKMPFSDGRRYYGGGISASL